MLTRTILRVGLTVPRLVRERVPAVEQRPRLIRKRPVAVQGQVAIQGRGDQHGRQRCPFEVHIIGQHAAAPADNQRLAGECEVRFFLGERGVVDRLQSHGLRRGPRVIAAVAVGQGKLDAAVGGGGIVGDVFVGDRRSQSLDGREGGLGAGQLHRQHPAGDGPVADQFGTAAVIDHRIAGQGDPIPFADRQPVAGRAAAGDGRQQLAAREVGRVRVADGGCGKNRLGGIVLGVRDGGCHVADHGRIVDFLDRDNGQIAAHAERGVPAAGRDVRGAPAEPWAVSHARYVMVAFSGRPPAGV